MSVYAEIVDALHSGQAHIVKIVSLHLVLPPWPIYSDI